MATALLLVPSALYVLGRPYGAAFTITLSVSAALWVGGGLAVPLFALRRAVERFAQAEERLQRFHAAWTAAPDPLIFLDRDGLVIEASNAVLPVFGYTPGQVRGRSIEALIPGISGANQGRVFCAISSDGREFPVEATFVPVPAQGASATALIVHDISVQRAAEAEIRRNEQLLIAAQRLAGMGSWDIDLKTGIVQRSSELLRIFERDGESPRTFLEDAQARMYEIIHPDDRARYSEFIAGITKASGVTSTEHRIVLKDGSVRHVRLNCHGVLDDDGKLIRVIGAGQDVTAEKQIQENLRRNEQRLSEAQRMAKIGSWELLPEANYIHWSEGLYAMYEVAPLTFHLTPESAERIVMAHIHPEDLPLVQAAARGFGGSKSIEWEHRMIMPDGRVKYVLSRVYSEQDSSGRVIRTLGVVQDVTARHLAKQEIQKREAQLRLITNSLPVSITYLDVDETVLFINQTGARWYGRDPAEIIGRRHADVVDPEEYEIFRPFRERAFLGETIHDEREVEFHSGAKRWIEFQFLPDFSSGRIIRGIYILISDIDARKRMERKLAQAQKMEAIGQLTGGIAHDFNNILTVIRGNLQLFGMTSERKPNDDRIQRAIVACGQASDIVSRLLTFARRQDLRPMPVSVGDLVRNIATLLRGTLIEEIEIKTVLPSDPVWIEADPSQLESALVNLCLNARDAMSQGGAITIRVDVSDAAPGLRNARAAHVCVAVSDTGVGMSDDVKQRVLEPFFTTKDFGKGSGLGLSMVHGFVEQSGGSLRIESEMGQGTTVSLYLPACRPAKQRRNTQMEKIIEGTGAHKILVVEDRVELREMVVTFLRGVGYDIVEASNGAEALALIESAGHLDLLFTDIVMPGGMNGAELARQAKALSPEMRVLYTTGYVRSDDAAALGEDVLVLKKPYALSELAEIVAQALKAAA
jgi:PAS domain S-box-containing protein